MTRKRIRKVERENDALEFGNVNLSLEPETTNYLVPVGIPGLYQSPVEPVDPRDCERWPESPYCGSNPLNQDFIDLSVELSINPCEQCFTFSPILGGISLPPYTVCRRSSSPECIALANDPGFNEIPFPEDFPETFTPMPYQNKCANGETFEILRNGGLFPGETYTEVNSYQSRWHSGEGQSKDNLSRTGSSYAFKILIDRYLAQPGAVLHSGDSEEWGNYIGANNLDAVFINGDDDFERSFSYRFKGEIHDAVVQYRVKERRYVVTADNDFAASVIYRQEYDFQLLNSPCDLAGRDRPALSPPYPLQNDGPCCMACSQDSEELLRLIAKRLSVSDFPVTVPQSLLADRGNNTQSIESLTGLVFWFIKQFDGIIGQFPIEIEIQDSDPTKQGDQKQKLTIPNLAEGIAELAGITLGSNINTNTLINIGIRSLTESGSGKIHALEARYLAQAIADYLAFDSEEVKTPVPMTFTPGKFELDDILQEDDQNVMLTTYKDDRDFKSEMTELLQAAAIIRAVHYRKSTNNGDIKGELLKRFKELRDMTEDKDTQGNDSRKVDFDDFLEKVESGFTSVAGIADVINPYGRDRSQRPKIRELGNTSDGTDEEI